MVREGRELAEQRPGQTAQTGAAVPGASLQETPPASTLFSPLDRWAN